MKSLEKIFNDIADDDGMWCYFNQNNGLKIKGVWNNNEQSYYFIKEYFEHAGKGRVFEDLFSNDSFLETENRAVHSVSAFLIGIYLAEELKTGEKYSQGDSEYGCTFNYIWFLTCLYHDYGYAFERQGTKKYNNFDSFVNAESINKFPKNYLPYKEEHIKSYFKNRKTDDHGIIGGLLLNDRLRKNYESSYETAKDRLGFVGNKKEFVLKENDRNLYFRKEHYKLYEAAAKAIIAHNIWKEPLQEYLKKDNVSFTLNDKILRKFDVNDYPLLFMLALSDTIEPIKRFRGIKSEYVLKNTYIDFDLPNTVKVSMDCPCFETEKYYKDIDNMADWLNVDVEGSYNNPRTISIIRNED